ncbi:hypothetical protein CSIM01_04448 [Colletotrichum simmondsii]|uniref:Uncharacterized protein n=1 Tax=Colletotrichum simmondsii TaxID=703756 RepID=A0A135T7M6_9PEZI|nr:hypothetical protein CSIM01_04448 [Colletotrichum simmondsii]
MGKVRAATQRQMHTIHVHTHSSTFPPSPCPPPPSPALASRHRSTGIPALDHGLVDCGAEAHTPSPGPPPPSGFALLLLLLAFALSQNLCSGSTGSTPDPSITGLARLDMDAHAPLLSGTICDQGITT